jgi:hypothetical protein
MLVIKGNLGLGVGGFGNEQLVEFDDLLKPRPSLLIFYMTLF